MGKGKRIVGDYLDRGKGRGIRGNGIGLRIEGVEYRVKCEMGEVRCKGSGGKR